jgi:superfamily II DNA or RNA helicase
VYIAPSVAIVRQTYEQLKSFFGEEYVSRIDGSARPGEKDPEKQIVVSTPVTASRMPQEWWDKRFMLVIDEFHHAAAETYHVINAKASSAYHRLCFTGTHFRTGEDELSMEAICSRKICKIEIADLVQQKYLSAPRVRFIPVGGGDVPSQRYDALYRHGIVEYGPRNKKIVELAQLMAYHRYPTLILVNRRNHADQLGQWIAGSKVVKGGEAALTDEAISEFRDGKFFVLIGTSVIGEGVDIPNAKALIYATGGGYTVGMMQSYFRPLTYQEDKPEGLIYDFYDNQNRTLKNHSERRFEYTRQHLGNCVEMI